MMDYHKKGNSQRQSSSGDHSGLDPNDDHIFTRTTEEQVSKQFVRQT